MSPLKYLTTVFCALFITIGAASGQEVKVFGALGGTVSFGPTSLNPPVSSIIWKHRRGEKDVVKAIEWDTEDGELIPHPRFKDITSLNRTTGQITIIELNIEHKGLYTIDINSKEQEQKYNLSFKDPVPKPVIKIDRSDKTSVFVYLICEYSETIIWKNSAGEKLDVKDHVPKGKFITVLKNGHPDDYYTCTLKNEVSEKTSDKVFRRDLFEEGGSPWIVLVIILILILAPFIVFVILYKVWPQFRKSVYEKFKGKPCIGGFLDCLGGNKDNGDKQTDEEIANMTGAQAGVDPTKQTGEEEKQDDKQSQHLKENGEDENEK